MGSRAQSRLTARERSGGCGCLRVKARVLLDAVFYQLDPLKPDGNDDTVRYLNASPNRRAWTSRRASSTWRPSACQRSTLRGCWSTATRPSSGVRDWSENSFRGNREVGVVIESKAVNGYYRRLFLEGLAVQPIEPTSADQGGSGSASARCPQGDSSIWLRVRGHVVRCAGGAQEGQIPCEQLGVCATCLRVRPTWRVRGGGRQGRVRKVHRAKNFVYLNFGEFWRQDYSVQIPLSVVETLAGRG